MTWLASLDFGGRAPTRSVRSEARRRGRREVLRCPGPRRPGHAAEILAVEDPDLGYDAAKFPWIWTCSSAKFHFLASHMARRMPPHVRACQRHR
jgi:hypothetical protein